MSYDNRDSAEKAISQMNGYQVRCRVLECARLFADNYPKTAAGQGRGQHGAALAYLAQAPAWVRKTHEIFI